MKAFVGSNTSMFALACALAQFASPAAAQTASPEPAVAPAASQQTGLDEIVVTARRRSENLQDTPVAVTALTADQIVQRSIDTIDDVAAFAPNVFTSSGGAVGAGNAVFSIRGQVQAETLVTVDPSVGVYIDGVYIARNNGILTDLVDLSRAEVLKGPQGTLYGRNTTGGAIALYTQDPTFDLGGRITGRYGRFNERGVEAVANVPLIADKLSVRFSGSILDNDGTGRNTVSGAALSRESYRSSRVKLLFQPTPSLSLLVAADYNLVRARGAVSKLAYLAAPGAVPFEGALLETAVEAGLVDFDTGAIDTAGAFDLLSAYRGGSRRRASTNAVDPKNGVIADNARHENWGVAGTLSWDVGPVQLKSITAYRELRSRTFVDGDATPFSILDVESRITPKQITQEFQIAGKAISDRLTYIVGAYYFHEKGRDETTSNQLRALADFIPQIVNPLSNFGDVTNRSRAVFAQGDFQIVPGLSVTAGIRYTKDTKRLAQFQLNGSECGIPPSLRTPSDVCLFDRSKSFDGISYTAGINYKPADDVLLYAKTSRGFRSGGQNLRARGDALLIAPSFKPETATDYEVGVKSEFLGRRVRLNAAGFYTDYRNIQKQTNRFVDGVTTSIINNAARGRVYGGEVELTAVPVDGLTLGASGGYTNARYKRFEDDFGDRSDEPFDYTPKFTYTLSADFTHGFADGSEVLAHADYLWVDATDFGLGGPGSREPSYGLLNGRITYRFADRNFEVAVFGKNLADKRYFESRLDFSDDLGYAVGYLGKPRTFGIEATVRFGAR